MNHIIHFQSESPSGTQLNALGIFLLSSLVFVVAALAEFSAVLFSNSQVSQDEMQKRKYEEVKECNINVSAQLRRRLNQSNVIGNVGTTGKIDIETLNVVEFSPKRCFLNIYLMCKVDYIAFWLFHTSYALFIFIYWSILNNK